MDNQQKPRVGRKSKYTPETVAKIVEALSVGGTHETAYTYAGISHETFYLWMREKPEFAELVQKTMAGDEVTRLARIKKAGDDGTWQADAWFLERRFPERYGRRVIQHEGNADKPLKIEVVYTDEASDDTD